MGVTVKNPITWECLKIDGTLLGLELAVLTSLDNSGDYSKNDSEQALC